MPKKIPPVHGETALSVFKPLEAEWDVHDTAYDLADVSGRVYDRINPGQCLTERQIEITKIRISNLGRRTLHQMRQVPEGASREIWSQLLVSPDGISSIVQEINSYRLDCENCLNATCQQRDPEKPVHKI